MNDFNGRPIKRSYIQLQGREEQSEELDVEQELDVTVEVIDIVFSNNHDGTVDRIYKCKLLPR